MARFATTISIAGVVFSGCRGLIQEGEGFADSVRGSVELSMNSRPDVQTIDTLYKGTFFGLELGSSDGAITIAKCKEVINAIKLARLSTQWFPFLYIDEQYNLNLRVKPDYNQKWYQYGPFSEGYVKGVTFRFVVHEAVAVSLI